MFKGGPLTEVLPIIDVRSLIYESAGMQATANEIGRACRDTGFFYVSNHGVPKDLERKLENEAKSFFARTHAEKMRCSMEKGGRAWRGYFHVGAELTSNQPDLKEGIYFGTELSDHHPLVVKKTPMHGKNLFPNDQPQLRSAVLDYMSSVTDLGHALMKGLALSLGLDSEYFNRLYTNDPLILFRIFNYPAPKSQTEQTQWGVGEHTDYGVLTILKQDQSGGLQVKSTRGWIDAPPIEDTFVCNIGDMLDRMTGGLYRSTPHRVRNTSGNDRLSFPLFFDPNFFAEVKPIAGIDKTGDDAEHRWDKSSVHEFEGTYGDYLLNKVSKVFPDLVRTTL